MASFNHRVEHVDPGGRRPAAFTDFCRRGKRPNLCGQPVAYWVVYDYVTGKAGRITDSRKAVCAEHAQLFAEHHGCEMPPPAGEGEI